MRRRDWLLGMTSLVVTTASDGGLVDIIASARKSVAAVGTYNELDNPRFGFRGSGFVVGDGNSLVTNAHVLPELPAGDRKSTLVVQFSIRPGEFETRPAEVERTDVTHDLVVLRFQGSPMPALRIADDKDIHEGVEVAFIGFPIGGVLGFRPVTHRGIISSITAAALPSPHSGQLKERVVRRLREGTFDLYQLDATAYPGNSGGPLLHAETGEVIGVVNMGLVKGTREAALSQPTGITYAIPAHFVEALLHRK